MDVRPRRRDEHDHRPGDDSVELRPEPGVVGGRERIDQDGAAVAGQGERDDPRAEDAGVPLGVAAGHWAWAAFATSLGAVPVAVVPVLALLAGFAVLLVAGNLLAAVPGAVAARTPPAAVLRAE